MAHFAQLDENNQVLQIIVVNNSDCNDLPFPDSEPVGVAFCKSILGDDTNWKQTSYNNNFRRRYASINGYYLSELDVFTFPQPFPSWTLNVQTGEWAAPIPKPDVPTNYAAMWDEEGQEWDIILTGASS
jgi:hypothetical protein